MSQKQIEAVLEFSNQKVTEILGDEWNQTTEKNFSAYSKKDSIWNLKGLFKDSDKEKAIIFIGAAPELKDAIPHLKKINRDHFCLIASNSALKTLLENDIRPDFTVVIDCSEVVTKHLLCGDKDLTLLRSSNSAPGITDIWKGKTYWIPYYGVTDPQLKKKIRRKLGKTIPTGGNSLSTAGAIAFIVFNARIFVFVASPYCFDNQYYLDKQFQKDKSFAWQKGEYQVIVHDVKGRKRYTNLAFYQYSSWWGLQAKVLTENGATLIDTSFGLMGVGVDDIHSMELENAIKQIEESFAVKQINCAWEDIERIKYNAAYATGRYIPMVGKGFYGSIFENYELNGVTTILDVGCGLGQTITMARDRGFEAYGTDIADILTGVWQEKNILSYCKVASAHNLPYEDNAFDLVTCIDVMEHIPPDKIIETLKEIRRVGNHDFFFNISVRLARKKFPHNREEPHLSVFSPNQWMDFLVEAGFPDSMYYNDDKEEKCVTIRTLKELPDDRDQMRITDLHLQPRRKVPKTED